MASVHGVPACTTIPEEDSAAKIFNGPIWSAELFPVCGVQVSLSCRLDPSSVPLSVLIRGH